MSPFHITLGRDVSAQPNQKVNVVILQVVGMNPMTVPPNPLDNKTLKVASILIVITDTLTVIYGLPPVLQAEISTDEERVCGHISGFLVEPHPFRALMVVAR